MPVNVTGLKLEEKQSSFETIAKKKSFILGTLSALPLLFNQVDVTCFCMSWWVDDPQKEMRCLEQNVILSESSLLAATIIGMISCPCMDSIYWWEFEIEFRENPWRSWGLRWRFFPPSWPHLPCFYWLCDDKCWQIVCALLFCQNSSQKSECTSASSVQEDADLGALWLQAQSFFILLVLYFIISFGGNERTGPAVGKA